MSEVEIPRYIKMFMKGLPYEAREGLIREYEGRVREIEFILSVKKNSFQYLRRQENFEQSLGLLLAMAVFYRQVVKPLEGGSRFFELCRTSNREFNSVQAGSLNLNSERVEEIDNAINSYRALLGRFGFNEYFFNFSSTEEFISWFNNALKDGLLGES